MADFDKINEQLFESSYLANRYANVLMPILGNLGNVSFVLTALVGGLFALNGVGSLTIGGLMAFLQLNRSFNGPITQVSQQLNFVLMALAGADRIFDLLDEPEEVDQGKVTLVNYELVDGQMVVTDKKTNLWAWKHPRPNGDYELVELVGNVSSKTLISLTMVRNKSFMASTCTRIRGKKWPLSERLVQERQLSPT